MAQDNTAVLILDADEPTRLLYQRELERVYQVFACDNERDALTVLREHAIAALILEPATLGDEQWSFMSLVHTTPQWNTLPLIVCSTLDARRRGHELGAAAYLIKPVTPALLLSTVVRLLQNVSVEPKATNHP